MKNTHKSKSSRIVRSKPRPLALEQRFMFDGAAVAEAVDTVTRTIDAEVAEHSAQLAAEAAAVVAQSQFTPEGGEQVEAVAPDQSGHEAEARATVSVGAESSLYIVKADAGLPAVIAAQREVEQRLGEWFSQPDAVAQLFSLFQGNQGAEPSAEWLGRAQALVDAMTSGTASVRLELRNSQDLLGLHGVFAGEGPDGNPVIYLNANWAATASASDIARVLMEETGHWIDRQINGDVDTRGDEGELFAATVYGVTLSELQRDRIAFENDHVKLFIDGREVDVEMASLLFSGQSYFAGLNTLATGASTADGNPAGQTAMLEANVLYIGNKLQGDRTVFVSDPPDAAYYSGNNVRGNLYAIDANNNIVARYYGEISRLIKDGSTAVAAQMFIYAPGTTTTNYLSTTIILDFYKDRAPTLATGMMVKTSSDPVASALNSMLPQPLAVVASADSATALEAGGVSNTTAGVNASGNVISNDSGGTTTYRISADGTKVETVTSGLSLTGVTSVATGSSGVPAAGSTATSGYTTVAGLYGTLRIGADGSYTYLVDNNNTQVQALRTTANTLTESFTYKVAAGTSSGASTLTITIQGANDAPVARDDYNVAKFSTLSTGQYSATDTTGYKASGSVLTNDTDVDAGDTKSLLKIYGTASVTTNGPTVLSFSALNSSVTVGDFAFLDGASKTPLRDAAGNQIKIASIDTVNKTFTLSGQVANATLTGGTVLGFSAKADASSGYKTTTMSSSAPAAAPTMSISGVDGTIAVGMTLKGTGLATDPTVTAVTYDASGKVTALTLSQSVVLNGQTLTFEAAPGTTITGQYGTLSINSNGSYTYTPTTNVGAGVTKVDAFKYLMEDTAKATSNATLYITVVGSGPNDPVANVDTANATEAGGVNNGTAGADAIANSTSGVLANDSTTSGNNTISTIKSTQVAAETALSGSVVYGGVTYQASVTGLYGTLYIKTDGSYAYVVDNNNPTVQALRTAGDTLTDSFQYKVSNGSGINYSLLNVTVKGANDNPVAVADSNLAIANQLDPSGNVLPNDTDVDAGDSKTVTKIAAGNTTSPGTDVTGSVAYDGVTYNVKVDGLYGSLYIKSDGSYRYVVNSALDAVRALDSTQTVTDVFSYQMKDTAGATSTTTLTLTVQGSNEAPVNTLPDNFSAVTQGSSVSLTGVSTSDIDKNLASVTISVLNGTLRMTEQSSIGSGSALETTLTGGAIIYGTATYNADGTLAYEGTSNGTSSITLFGTQAQINAALATLVYTPNTSFSGTDTFTITAIDSEGLKDVDTKAITVNAGSIAINNIAVNEGSPYAVFTVTGSVNQTIALALSDGTASGGGTDYGATGASNLEYSLDGGLNWTSYSAPFTGTLTGGGLTSGLLVRTPVTPDSSPDNGETFKLTVTPSGVTANAVVGTATIYDNGTGQWFTGASGTPATSGFVLDDDRPLSVNNIDVNEGSPYAVFTVTGAPGQLASLALPSETGAGKATQGTDYGSTLQYFNGSTWQTYTPGDKVPLDATGTLLVRTTITNDASYEGPETFTLTATNTGGTPATGTATIHDDGTGLVYQDNTTGNPDPNAVRDDDRTLHVNSVTVNEASPYAVFVISNPNSSAISIQQLTLSKGTADLNLETSGTNATRVVQYFDGANWVTPGLPVVASSSGGVTTSWTVDMNTGGNTNNGQGQGGGETYPAIAAGGQLLVRVVITGESDATYEGAETFTLTARTTTSVTATGTATIVDDGTGAIYPDNKTGLPDPLAALDDDRPVKVNNIEVNEGSPYAVFTVTGGSNQGVVLSLQNDSDPSTANAVLGTDTGTQLQYFDGTIWQNYSAGSTVYLVNGQLLVRNALKQDGVYEGPETYQLKVSAPPNITWTAPGNAVYGTATIWDDGTGAVYPDNATGNPDPNAVLDDDRALQINSVVVNEASPYMVFQVKNPGSTPLNDVYLSLQNDNDPLTADASLAATGGDVVPTLEYYNGSSWVSYGSGPIPSIAAGATVLVRVAVNNETSNPVYEGAETLLLRANIGSAIGPAFYGTGTIVDDGTGAYFPDNTAGNPDPNAVLDDDRPVQVNSIVVNEASPYAVFAVTGTANQYVTLALANDSDPVTADATLGVDTGSTLQYLNASGVWTPYTAGAAVQLPASGQLLVRTTLSNDSSFEGPEVFQLRATVSNSSGATTGGTSVGTATIVDDGTGAIYPNNTTGAPDPNAVLDDDRPLQVNSIVVNEGSPYGVFSVSATAGQVLKLALTNDNDPLTADATIGTDTGSTLQYFNGTAWVNYDPNVGATVPAGGELLVRFTLTQDALYEGPEVLQLQVSNTSGTAFYGTATIVDDGTGAIYPDNTTGNPDPNALLDDDRSVKVNSIVVNEASPYAVFTVTVPSSTQPQYLKLGLQNDNDPLTANATLGVDTGNAGTNKALQYYDPSFNNGAGQSPGKWVDYTPDAVLTIAANQTTLLVRTAIVNDTVNPVFEGPETFLLRATVTNAGGTTAGASSYGEATIVDDGTGAYYPNNTTGNPDPNAILDDDRPVQVNSIVVNEGSPYGVFSVSATAGQVLRLALTNDNDPLTADATIGTDTGSTLQYFNGTAWVNYDPNVGATVPAGGVLLVRFTLQQDAVYEGPEALQLQVTNTGGAAFYGTATIVDDGTGAIYPNNTTGAPDPNAPLDDDRGVKVNNIVVNEASPYAVFTVTVPSSSVDQYLKLGLQNDNDPLTANATLGVDTGNAGTNKALQYYDPSFNNGAGQSPGKWVDYTPDAVLTIAANQTTLLVRTAIVNDTVNPVFEGPETFLLRAIVTNGTGSTTGAASYGTATIVDDGTGAVYPDNTTGNPDPNAVLDDDRPLQVNNILVNEGSPYAVFTVSGAAGQTVTLSLQNDSDPATADATLGVDTGTALQYLNANGVWTAYNLSSPPAIPAGGQLLVRTTLVNDSAYEGAEVFQLKAVASGGSAAYGTATIVDDGTGAIYPNNTTGNPDPNAVLDDDRPVQVNSITVNEGSPFGVFTVTANAGQVLKLDLVNDNDPTTPDATIGTDTGSALQYFNGTAWVNYNPSVGAVVPGNGELLVRFAVTPDAVYEGPEALQLKVSNTAGAAYYGTGTIVDDGTGLKYPDASPVNGVPVTSTDSLDDDRTLQIGNVTVNEASPYMVFEVKNPSTTQTLSGIYLSLQNDNDPLTADASLAATGGDVVPTLEYYTGSSWVSYGSGPIPNIAAGATVLVRLAVNNETSNPVYEGAETLLLRANIGSASGPAFYGTGTIVDDGTGTVFPNNTTGAPDPSAVRDDDRPLHVNSIVVNEGSPYAVFQVTGAPGQLATLALPSETGAGKASQSTDYGSALQYFNGSTWQTYTAGAKVPLDATGTLLVRTTIVNDAIYEGAETFTLTATNTGGSTATGTATILDDGTGLIYPDNTTGTPDLNAPRNDDRALQISPVIVNEASPYMVFRVTNPGNEVSGFTFSLEADTNPSTTHATIGNDTGSTLQYLVDGSWTSTPPGSIGAGATLLVRVAVVNDNPANYEGPETLLLKATVGSNVSYGTGTIVDDGTGLYFPDTTTGVADPNAVLDDDRPLKVNNITVNEGSPFAVFTVTGSGNQGVVLSLQNDSDPLTVDATIGTDTGTILQFFNGGAWVVYSPGSTVNLIDGQLLVRTIIVNDGAYEGPEAFQLKATTTGGSSATGTATIVDDGTGAIYPDNLTGNPDPNAPRDDDRVLQINSVVVNEASPYMVFQVKNPGSTALSGIYLGLQNDNDPLTVDASLSGADADVGSALQYFDGTGWVTYNAGSTATRPDIAAGATLLVRVAVNNDSPAVYEGAETLLLRANIGSASGPAFYGTGTIVDDGTGAVFPNNTTGAPDPSAVRDDDRPLHVNSIVVNEGSPYAVFTVTGAQGQAVTLSLQGDNDPATANATPGTDYGPALQYLSDNVWTDYDPLNPPQIPTGGQLLVRTTITNDNVYEGAETFLLKAATAGGAPAYGTATIVDDGTGAIYPNNTTGNPDPNALRDDDRPVQVNNIVVNEGSPYGVFTVSATPGQVLKLALTNDNDPATPDAAIGVDTGSTLQYFNGTAWVAYDPNLGATVPAGGELLVRFAITPDDVYEGPEALQLKVTNLSGSAYYGTGTIVDDGTGLKYPDAPPVNGVPVVSTANLDDDRALKINNVTVNEASPYMVFQIFNPGGAIGSFTLGLQNDNDPLTADAKLSGTGADVGGTLEYLVNGSWTSIQPASIGAGATLLVRVAVVNDNPAVYEGPETLLLKATVGSNAFYGKGTIVDDGTGSYFAADNTTGTPALPAGVNLDDDRSVKVNSISVNEGSPYAVFTVTVSSSTQAQYLRLGLQNDNDPLTVNARLGVDTQSPVSGGRTLQYLNGNEWVDYDPNALVTLAANQTTLLVRTGVVNDTAYEGPETFLLKATITSSDGANDGMPSYGTATILDDGTGTVFNDDGSENTTAIKDDDRAITVSGGTYNEGSPRAVFEVQANPGQRLTLAVQDVQTSGLASAPIYYSVDGGQTWQRYTGAFNAGDVPVLVAVDITGEADNRYEGSEELKLVVNADSPNQAAASAFIVDDGTGNIAPAITADSRGITRPMDDLGGRKDDDRPVPPPPSAPPPVLQMPPPIVVQLPYVDIRIDEMEPALPRPELERDLPMLSVANGIADQYADAGTRTSFAVPFDAFAHSDPNERLALSAVLADGSKLPKWVVFDASSGKFVVEPPKGFKGELRIKVTARDSRGNEVSTMFRFHVGKKAAPPVREGRASFSEQLRQVSRDEYSLDAVLSKAEKGAKRSAARAS